MKRIELKKNLIIGLLGSALFIGLTGCGKTTEKDLDVKAVANSLLTQIDYEDQLSEVTYDMIYDMEGLNVTESAVYVSSGATAEEIAAIKCDTSEDAAKAQAILEERVIEQKESFRDYVPKELDKLDKAVIIKTGKTVVLSVSNDDEKAKDIIKNSTK